MPQTLNVTAPPGTPAATRSIRYWLYRSSADRTVEVASTVARFVLFEAFTAVNGGGSSLGVGSIDTSPLTVFETYKATTVQELLAAAFG